LVNARDLFFFSQSWKDSVNPANSLCDADGDGMIDEHDFFLLISEW